MNNKNSLKRDLGFLDAYGIGIGAVVGAGIFVVIGVAAGVAGPSLLIGFLIAGIAATCNGLSSAQLASIYPQSGGTYEYGYQVLNPWFGFSAGWMFLISKLVAGGVVALGFGNYLSQIFPFISPKSSAITVVIILTLLNYFGIKKAGKINLIIIIITIMTLLYFIIVGIPFYDKTNLSPFAPNGVIGIGESAALLFFAFTGYARIATLGEEVSNPKKNIPRAIILTLITSIVLYFTISLIAIGSAGANTLAESNSPLVDVARTFNSPGLVTIISIGATTAMLGVLLSQILGISRMMFAMSRKGDLPKALNMVHTKYKVPHIGIFLSGLIILLLTIFGSIKFIVASATFTILLYYSIANLAAIKLKVEKRLIPKWVSYLGLVSCLLLAISLDINTIISGIILLVIGFLYRFLKINIKSKR